MHRQDLQSIWQKDVPLFDAFPSRLKKLLLFFTISSVEEGNRERSHPCLQPCQAPCCAELQVLDLSGPCLILRSASEAEGRGSESCGSRVLVTLKCTPKPARVSKLLSQHVQEKLRSSGTTVPVDGACYLHLAVPS